MVYVKSGEEVKEAFEKLTKDSKPLKELVVSEDFIVQGVLSQNYSLSLTPQSEAHLGGKSPKYDVGCISKLRMNVDSTNPKCIVHLINFEGYSPVRAGDHITVLIPRYKVEGLLISPPAPYDPLEEFYQKEKFYLEREFDLEESAIEIITKSYDGKELRRDRSVDYGKFFK